MSGTSQAVFEGAVDLGSLEFREPWAARLFGVTLAMSERGLFTMKDFQHSLIAAVGDFEKASCIRDEEEYYTRWLEALSVLLKSRGIMKDEMLSATEERVVERLLGLQHERHHHHEHSPGRPDVIAPLVVA
ncbi:nitrile hydratase accessory protein [Terrihabitans rhizophilus]|jgi:nitrile hydratase accessory protein|uniref:Nitrile hydratase accessory protein n=1 Tax=Terrihabitans rhizophilus TaxID=3092662 RepID=A0ABU4RIM8_9HYPH|nr:nitrile hydratase accessory protein [Terrihabitans sp. PJ23]MDX6804680.1 nitrile hydratase accessory protein [Terrihabitans sp. PJ23]